MKAIFSSVFFLTAFSASALEIERRFTAPMVSYGPGIDETQKGSVDDLLEYMNKELTFIEGGRAPGLSQAQRFGGSAAETSRFIGLLRNAGLWEVQVRFRDFGEQDSAFIIIDHSSPDLKTVEVNSGRQDFLLHHFTEHLPQLDKHCSEAKKPEAEQDGSDQAATRSESKSGPGDNPKPQVKGRSR